MGAFKEQLNFATMIMPDLQDVKRMDIVGAMWIFQFFVRTLLPAWCENWKEAQLIILFQKS